MERTKNNKDGEQIRWKKTGLGSLRIGNRIIKPGQIFSARPDEISEGFRDIIIPLDTLPEEEASPEAVATEYILQKRESGGYYDVVDGNGKIMNEKALRRDGALQLIKDLE